MWKDGDLKEWRNWWKKISEWEREWEEEEDGEIFRYFWWMKNEEFEERELGKLRVMEEEREIDGGRRWSGEWSVNEGKERKKERRKKNIYGGGVERTRAGEGIPVRVGCAKPGQGVWEPGGSGYVVFLFFFFFFSETRAGHLRTGRVRVFCFSLFLLLF